MNSYERYLEKQLELKEKEIEIYKNFIEGELKTRIVETVESDRILGKNGFDEVFFKIITIPKSQYIVELGD